MCSSDFRREHITAYWMSLLDEPLLHVAAARGHANEVRFLMRHKGLNCDANAVDHEGRTALALAAERQHYVVMKLLIDAGCDVNKIDHHGNCVLSEGVQENNLNCVKILLAANVDINIRDSRGRSPLHLATLSGNMAMVELLVTAGCHLDIQDDDGFTPVFLAAWMLTKNVLLILRTLIDAGANLNIRDVTNRPPITAAWSRWLPLVYLIQSGCNVIDVKINNYSLLMVAAFENDVQKIELLRMAGARVSVEDLQLDVVKRHKAHTGLLEEMFTVPLSLKAQCRIRARKCMRRPLARNVHSLTLPHCLMDYLTMEEWT